MTRPTSDLEQRIHALEAAVTELQQSAADRPRTPADDRATTVELEAGAAPASTAEDDPLWFVKELGRQCPGAVMMAGNMDVPDAGPVTWQYALPSQALLAQDWTELAATIDALGHPVRLTILQLIMNGIRTTSELVEQDALGTTGQLHHHLRQLVAAGWLTSTRRGHYEVPPQRVVPLMVILLAANR